MPSFDLASQLEGSQKGHATNVAIDKTLTDLSVPFVKAVEDFIGQTAKTEAAAFLTNAGHAATLAGAVDYVIALGVTEIGASALSATAKAGATAVLKTLGALIASKVPAIDL